MTTGNNIPKHVAAVLLSWLLAGPCLCGPGLRASQAGGPPPRPEAGTAARAIYDRSAYIMGNMRQTSYALRVNKVVDDDAGIYRYDCSGLVGMIILNPVEPGRCAELNGQPCKDDTGGQRPMADTFYDFALTLPYADTPECGGRRWCRVRTMMELRPGDTIAAKYDEQWRLAHSADTTSTGHVMLVWGSPAPSAQNPGELEIFVMDAADTPHGTDTRQVNAVTGLGETFGNVITGCCDPKINPACTESLCGTGRGKMWFGLNAGGEPAYYRWSSPTGCKYCAYGSGCPQPAGKTCPADTMDKLAGIALLRPNGPAEKTGKTFSWPLFVPVRK